MRAGGGGGVDAGDLREMQGAEVLGLSERHVWRLLAAYRVLGAAALVHGNRGRRPQNAVPSKVPPPRSTTSDKIKHLRVDVRVGILAFGVGGWWPLETVRLLAAAHCLWLAAVSRAIVNGQVCSSRE